MRAAIAVGWRLLRSADGRNRIGAVLVLAAVSVSTALLMFAVAANHAFDARAAREAWRFPQADAHGSAIEATSTDYVRGRPITVVELARAGAHPPVPPGMTTFPRPGERWISPALAALMRDLPADELADRFAGRGAAHRLGPDALVYPDELVVVVGRAATDPSMTAGRENNGGEASSTRISAYATTTPSMSTASNYTILAKVAAVLMVVPLLVFGGAAARLTVARREQRLAALRLVGATPRQVVVTTVAEAVVTALFGVVAGLAAYAAAMPLLARITMMDGTWFLGDLWPGPLWLAGVVVGVPLLVGASAVVGLRRVVVSPLGVANRQTPPGLKAVRAVVAIALLIAFTVAAREAGRLGRRHRPRAARAGFPRPQPARAVGGECDRADRRRYGPRRDRPARRTPPGGRPAGDLADGERPRARRVRRRLPRVVRPLRRPGYGHRDEPARHRRPGGARRGRRDARARASRPCAHRRPRDGADGAEPGPPRCHRLAA